MQKHDTGWKKALIWANCLLLLLPLLLLLLLSIWVQIGDDTTCRQWHEILLSRQQQLAIGLTGVDLSLRVDFNSVAQVLRLFPSRTLIEFIMQNNNSLLWLFVRLTCFDSAIQSNDTVNMYNNNNTLAYWTKWRASKSGCAPACLSTASCTNTCTHIHFYWQVKVEHARAVRTSQVSI